MPGLSLSEHELRLLTRAAETLLDPFGFGTIDGWREAVIERLKAIVRADVGIFYLFRTPTPDQAQPVFSRDLSADQVADYIRYALFDAGSDRVLAYGLSAINQRQLVGEDWEAYHADRAVNKFYLPNRLLDSVALVLFDRDGRKEASVELHRDDFGTRLFGEEGSARLGLLLPAIRAAVAAVRAAATGPHGLESLLGDAGYSVALADARGRITFRSSSLAALIDADPEGSRVAAALEGLASSHAGLFEARGWGCRHRNLLPSLEGARHATATITTAAGRYQLSAVEAPASLNSGRHGFLLRIEPMFDPRLDALKAKDRFRLTTRELQVARLLAAGSTNDAISAALGISTNTARRHTEKVFAKLGVNVRAAVGPAMRGTRAQDDGPASGC